MIWAFGNDWKREEECNDGMKEGRHLIEGKRMRRRRRKEMIVVCEGIFGYIDGRKDGFGFGIGGIFCSPSLGVLDSAGL
jgi:hypothetical protein